ncbi:response regulator [Scopulibacillus cellulosilyticus]|uniref:Transcriptional regulatory protein n=1 Tax=Scopulibacillus cellulosilyticus TaxID=2665665 RepID=A0ABW2PXV1_9BACL
MIRVLIVEDDPMVAEINKSYLKSIKGFTCAGVAANVSDGLALLEENPVDLVLLDIFMPRTNGLEFLADIRKKRKGIDVIIISAASDIEHIKASLRLGAVDYLIKPFEFQRFNSALLKYQKEQEFLKAQAMVNQDELDRLLLKKDIRTAAPPPELPKGLTLPTLRLTIEQIHKMEKDGFSTEELANKVGISRISMRKYLQFLTDIEFVFIKMAYGNVGRPVYKYHLNKGNEDKVKPYMKADDDS